MDKGIPKNGINKGRFKKGHKAWNIGLTKETDKRVRNISENEKGKKQTEEAKKLISKNNPKYWLGKKRPPFTKLTRKSMSLVHKGKHNSPETEFKKGENPNLNLKKRLCLVCGLEYLPNSHVQKYCCKCSKQKDKNRKDKWKENNSNYSKEYYQKNKKKLNLKSRIYFQENKIKLQSKIKEYRINNKEKRNKTEVLKRKNDKEYLIKYRLRHLLLNALKRYTKTGKIMFSKKYGIDYKAIIEHLKPLPENLKNYDIHHIKPLFTFNFINPDGSTNLEEIKKAFAPENHKILLKEEHRKINHFKLK